MKKLVFLICFILLSLLLSTFSCQENYIFGIGLLPTGTETGFTIRGAKQNKFVFDVRVSKTNLFFQSKTGGSIGEFSLLYRIAYHEKLRLNLGIGTRMEWSLDNSINNRYGLVLPIGIEAFPFPFQNGGLFFEIAPFFTSDKNNIQNLGLKSSSGFIYYITKKQKKHEKI